MAKSVFQKRMIHVNFLSSPDLIDLPDWAIKVFLAMCLHCDDEGIIRSDPGYLRAITWPASGSLMAPLGRSRGAHRANIGRLCDLLLARSVLSPANSNGVSCYRLTNFKIYNPPSERRKEGRKDSDEERKGKDPPLSFDELDAQRREAALIDSVRALGGGNGNGVVH